MADEAGGLVTMENGPSRNKLVFVSSLFSKLSLRSKLILFFLTVALISVAAVAFVVNRISSNGLTAEVGTNLKSLANSQATTIGDLLSHEVNTVKVFSLNQTVRDTVIQNNLNYTGDPTAVQSDIGQLDQLWRISGNSDPLILSVLNNNSSSQLREYSNTFPDNVEILATDKYGATIAATSRPSTYNQAKEEWWQKAYNNGQGDTYIGQPEYDENRAAYSLSIAVPIYATGTKEVVGILHSTFRTGALAAALFSTQFGQNADAYILFPNGQVLMGKGNYLQADAALLNYHKTSSNQTYLQISIGSINRLISEAPISSFDPLNGQIVTNLGWTMIVTRDPTQAFQPVNTASQTTLLTSLIVLFITALLGVVGAQILASPITHLTSVAIKVASGDMKAQAQVESQDEIGTLAITFNQMTNQLSNQINTLEQRVKERTSDLDRQAQRLRAASEVARDAASSRDPQEFLDRAALLIYLRFGFYHTGIFIIDQDRQYAVLRASPTKAGQKMLENKHRLRVGEQGLVGHVAASGEPRIALDTGADAVYFNNPLLPDTHSEIAIPLKSYQGIIGVLDIQSDQTEAFTQEDIYALQGMADQLTNALERIRLLRQVETRLDELEKSSGEFTEHSWKAFARERQTAPGYRYDGVRLEPITELSNDAKKVLSQSVTTTSNSSDKASDSSMAAVPIRLRGQTIGVINVQFQSETPSQTTLAMIEQISERLAAALENTRLVEETRQRAQRDALVSEIGGRLHSTLDLETVLKTAAAELQQAFQLKEAEIRLGTSIQGESTQEGSDIKTRKNGKRRE